MSTCHCMISIVQLHFKYITLITTFYWCHNLAIARPCWIILSHWTQLRQSCKHLNIANNMQLLHKGNRRILQLPYFSDMPLLANTTIAECWSVKRLAMCDNNNDDVVRRDTRAETFCFWKASQKTASVKSNEGCKPELTEWNMHLPKRTII